MNGHLPVLVEETLAWLAPPEGGSVVDGTAGLGGHAARIAERLGPRGLLVLLDRDAETLARAEARVRNLGPRVVARHESFARIGEVVAELAPEGVAGILVDLGISSVQLDEADRGFSFRFDAPLDMRMDRSAGETAADLVNRTRERDLADLIWRFGEERRSRAIARAIVEERRHSPIRTTAQLADLVRRVVRGRPGGIDPATRTFQALRIAVNDELEALERFLSGVWDALRPGGRVVAISFHSLEDRQVKTAFRREAGNGRAIVLTRKPVVPGEAEERANPRARSAKLRAAERAGATLGPGGTGGPER